jgi:HK97 family phage major capsid protein
MSLEKIKELGEKVEAASAAVAKVTELEETVKSMSETIAEFERKKSFAVKTDDAATIAKLKSDASTLYLKSIITKQDVRNVKGFGEIADLAEKTMKPADITNFLAEQFTSEIKEKMELELKVESLFPSFTIPQNMGSISIPQKLSNASAYLIAPSISAIESAITAGKVNFATKRIKSLVTVADQATQEAIGGFLDIVKMDVAKSLARATENALINGDTTSGATNINGTTVGGDANDVTRAFMGLRYFGLNNTVDFGAAAVTTANMLKMRKQLGVYGVNTSGLVYLIPASVLFQVLALPEVVTVDKYGMSATILTGEVAKFMGIPIVVTEYLYDNLETTGKYVDAGSHNRTSVVLVNREYFAKAERGGITLEQDRDIKTSVDAFVGYRDLDFNRVYPSNSIISYGINITF